MKKNPFALGIAVIIIVILGGIIFSASRTPSNSPAPSYDTSSATRPRLSISQTNFDMGKMKLIENRTQSLTIQNVGEEVLDLRNFSTSCGCTTVQVVINEQKSPSFSMHNNLSWIGKLAPGQSADLLITYTPSVHPAKGSVSRSVFFETNDPQNRQVEITFNAWVEE